MINDVYEITVDTDVDGEHCQNVLHFLESVACTDPIPAESLTEALVSAFTAEWPDILSDQCQLTCVYGRRISPAFGVPHAELIALDGTVVSQPIPTTSAAVVTWNSIEAGASKRGRSYFAGLPETFQNHGNLTSAAVTAIDALAAVLSSDIVAVGGDTGEWRLCVWSPKLLSAVDVASYVVRTNLASQRGRRHRPGVAA